MYSYRLSEEVLEPTKVDGNDTTTLSYHPYILCHSCCQLCTPQNSLHALSLFIHTKWTRCSALLTPQNSINPYLPCSAAIKFHNINSNIPYRLYAITYHTYHTDPTLLMDSFLHTGKTGHICHAQYSRCIVHCSHPTPHAHQHALSVLPTTWPSITLCTQLRNTQSIFV